jgi:hypothetical protein
MLTVFGSGGVTMYFTKIEISYPTTGKMHGGKNRDSNEVDNAEYLYPCRHRRCRCNAGIRAGTAPGLVM